ncbi:hypothetical protein Zmor_006187 [Zophobas morio]|uniref:Pentatricopeptide repeat-containing protein 1 n=1 Tax=Zophobas morio TaxID=2755281 RepID=A0AA38ML72_9CUCU|nr:hypothetical protein Zmor_006187 [Zophobas morio]
MFRLRIISRLTCKGLERCRKFESKRHQHVLILKGSQFAPSTLTCNVKPFSHASETTLETEQEYLVRLKNDPDTFGDSREKEISHESDLKEEKHFEEQVLPSQKSTTKQYADVIKSLIRKRKIKEAIDVLEVKMLQEDKVKPENYIYNLVIGACGRVGYTKKAFSLYNQMKKRDLKITAGTYTALFNACANSPWPEDGLSRAKHLRNIMIEKMYEPNATNYNAMIKAFGRCGDLTVAFALVDEMMIKKIPIKDDTLNFLLQACVQDKEAGFRHALLVWRKSIEKNIPPSLYTYNLMLRCIRDCGIGDVEVMQDTVNTLLQNKSSNVKFLPESSTNRKLIQHSSTDEGVVNKDCKNAEIPNNAVVNSSFDLDVCRPNLMAKLPHLGNIVSFSEVTRAEDRLLLVGGCKGFFNNMVEHKCAPDIKTFTQLLNCLPGSVAAELELEKIMRKFDVKPDIDFFNMLIKKRSMRFDYDGGKQVLEEMKKFNYRPDLITFGVLSLGCKTKDEALQLLDQMKEHSYRLNTEILGAMLHQACHHKNFAYVLEIMEISLRENIKPNKIFMQCLQDFKKICKKISNDNENKLSQSQSFQKGHRIFQMRYKTWLEEIEVDDTEDIHPWAQYRQTTETDTRHYKDKSHRFKATHTSRFKVKTSTKRKYKR